ncbi:hypothetical protein [Klenkia terrae]|uniref:Uncharacterized protein n=1 Tax=Klenkia terrae TaxID=1052259 RepID=A0ABU8EBK7_9ACTN|nr:hypothetical protein [Klenkia terrae]SSC25530.1 Hypothetical protein KLENKIAIHU_4154 [Klenkia terrae]
MTTGPLAVRADLTLESGGLTARLTGDGTRLVLDASDPVALWRAAAGIPCPAGVTVRRGPGALGELAGVLAAQGLHLDVTGPRGRIAELGAGVSSPTGRVLTGSPAVRPGSVRTVAATVSTGLRLRPGLLLGAAAAVLLLRRLVRSR